MKTEKTREKGNSLLAFPADCVIIDLETTGCDPFYDEIIEFGAIRVRDNVPTDRMQIRKTYMRSSGAKKFSKRKTNFSFVPVFFG